MNDQQETSPPSPQDALSSTDETPDNGRAAAEAVLAASTDGQAEAVRGNGDLMENLFEALDEIAGVVLALEGDAAHTDKAETLDAASKRIIDTLVREFSFKSAQVEVLLRELDDVNDAWGDYAHKVAYRNERLQNGQATA